MMKYKILILTIFLSPIVCYGVGKEAVFKAIIAASKKNIPIEKIVAPTATSSADSIANHLIANTSFRITANCLSGYTATDKRYAEMKRFCNNKADKVAKCIKNNLGTSYVASTSELEELERFCVNVVK